jgi:hypothetical protein
MPKQSASSLKLDTDLQDRIEKLAQERHQSPGVILRQAIEQYLEREEKSKASEPGQHPSGKPWPRRNPVGGIITPI